MAVRRTRRKGFDAVLVLGVELDARDEPTAELIARVDAAAKAYARVCKAGCAVPLVVCGGVLPGHVRAEAGVMADLLLARGVPNADVVREDRSRDTMENVRFAARLLGGAKGRRVLIVTSDYHMRRALATARRVGFRARGEAARLAHDARWRALRAREICYMIDLLLGWQDEGKCRPEAAVKLFDTFFR